MITNPPEHKYIVTVLSKHVICGPEPAEPNLYTKILTSSVKGIAFHT